MDFAPYLPPPVPPEVRQVTSADGTRLYTTSYGTSDRVLVLAPGLATPPATYDYVIQRFVPDLRVVTWDMRGTYRSDLPADPAAYTVEDSTADLEAVVAAEGLDRFLLGGWSMGVQIALEYYRRHRERCLGLALLNGGYGNVLDHILPVPGSAVAATAILRSIERLGRPIDALVTLLLGKPHVLRALELGGVVTANPDFYRAIVAQFRTMHFGRYAAMMLALHRHSAEAWLEAVTVPTVVTAGTRDVMTPVHTARVMSDRIPDAELVVVPNGTHYTPIEYPDAINEALETLVVRIWPDLPGRVSARPRGDAASAG